MLFSSLNIFFYSRDPPKNTVLDPPWKRDRYPPTTNKITPYEKPVPPKNGESPHTKLYPLQKNPPPPS